MAKVSDPAGSKLGRKSRRIGPMTEEDLQRLLDLIKALPRKALLSGPTVRVRFGEAVTKALEEGVSPNDLHDLMRENGIEVSASLLKRKPSKPLSANAPTEVTPVEQLEHPASGEVPASPTSDSNASLKSKSVLGGKSSSGLAAKDNGISAMLRSPSTLRKLK